MPETRIDTASRMIRAATAAIYRAFADPEAWRIWLPPDGMRLRIDAFDFRVGGAYRMELTYAQPDHAAPGKSSAHSDVVSGRFVDLVPDRRMVQAVTFDSPDPAFAGVMTMTWTLTPVAGGTEVAIVCQHVPAGIRPEDHAVGLNATLGNLAAFVEDRSAERSRG